MTPSTARTCIALDIGSTYTKGARFTLSPTPRCDARASTPTTTDDLTRAVQNVLSDLKATHEANVPVSWSSSARGGLSIVAVGIVPELTAKVARIVAHSAGGKVVATYSYKLTKADVDEIDAYAPDIILFTGGTDGGNEAYNRHNARMLSRRNGKAEVIYAGNRALVDDIRQTLAGQSVTVTENVLPEIDVMNDAPARDAIRDVFLRKIVDGKGLSRVREITGRDPIPTPRALFDLVTFLADMCDAWKDTLLIDMGGATTDCYSTCESYAASSGWVLRGLMEPKVKRTVEGDLGLRVSARTLAHEADAYFAERFRDAAWEAFHAYIRKVHAAPSYIPALEGERAFDRAMARACVRGAVLRHAGRVREVYTPSGRVYVQRGKDLRGVTRVVGTGGYLATLDDALFFDGIFDDACEDEEGTPLLPKTRARAVDGDYLLPLIANVLPVDEYAARTLADHAVTPLMSV